MADSPISLREFDTDTLSPLGVRGAGTDKILLKISGNSILSSVFIKSISVGATLDVKYYQTTGATEDDGEKQALNSHAQFTPADNGITNTILVTRVHNKPFLEVTVTGGTAEYAIYATVLSEAASDIDSALKKDGQVADLSDDKGLPIMCYDETDNEYHFIRCEDGVIPVSQSEAGDPVHLTAKTTTTPNTPQDLITSVIPAGKTRKMSKIIVVCRSHSSYIVRDNSDIIASGRTGPANTTDVFEWSPRRSVAAGRTLKVTFTAMSGTPSVDVEAYVMASDL